MATTNTPDQPISLTTSIKDFFKKKPKRVEPEPEPRDPTAPLAPPDEAKPRKRKPIMGGNNPGMDPAVRDEM